MSYRSGGKFGTRALRKGRNSLPGQIYHVTTVTADRYPYFSDCFLGRFVVTAMIREENRHSVKTLAYVLMPDHLHWLFRLPPARALAVCVNNVKSLSARAVNRERRTRGRVWQKGFHDHALRADEEIRLVARYIIANPLRAGIVKSVGRYPLWDAIWVDDRFEL